MPFHIFRLIFPISAQKSCMTNAMQQGKRIWFALIRRRQTQFVSAGFPGGAGRFPFAENIPYAKEQPGAQRPATECKAHS